MRNNVDDDDDDEYDNDDDNDDDNDNDNDDDDDNDDDGNSDDDDVTYFRIVLNCISSFPNCRRLPNRKTQSAASS